jgi:Protein of unknown function (DUF2934)
MEFFESRVALHKIDSKIFFSARCFMKCDEQTIRNLAHEIWVAEGKPDGLAERHWLLARLKMAQTHSRSKRDKTSPFDPTEENIALESAHPDQT